MNDKLSQLRLQRDSIVIFRSLGEDHVISSLMYLIGTDQDKTDEYISAYADVAEALYEHSADLGEYVLRAVLENENMYIKRAARGENIPAQIQECLLHELAFFQEISQLTPEELTEELDYDGFLPRWQNSHVDIIGSYMERIKLVGNFGYGKWTRSNMFVLRKKKIVPVIHHDPQRLEQLFGYERERQAVIDNTLALIENRPALNALLYGDAGTGKSSTIKAVANEFAHRGLRLIEISKEQLRYIPRIIEEISNNPLKFIIFIDDLSFTSGEDCFGALKAALEGSVSVRGKNMVIYATSNRRHLVRESFSDREGDDIHRNDTMQEHLSLSARFGLRVSFSRPDKKSYTDIAKALARQNGLDMSDEELELKAEQFALSSGNGRSPRTAKQFIRACSQNKQA